MRWEKYKLLTLTMKMFDYENALLIQGQALLWYSVLAKKMVRKALFVKIWWKNEYSNVWLPDKMWYILPEKEFSRRISCIQYEGRLKFMVFSKKMTKNGLFLQILSINEVDDIDKSCVKINKNCDF